jgi:ATP-dependent Clp protease ATP-binding subunit ClpA
LLSQENLDRFKTEETPLSLVLFDEIEKASDALWKLLLGILDKGTLTLGDNRRVDFSRCVIVMTSNLGAREMSGLMSAGIGFAGAQRANSASDGDSNIDEKIYRTAVQAASRNFAPEFMNRIDKVVVFHSLNEQHLRQILDLELCALQERILRSANTKFVFQCSAEVKEMLLREGIDYRYGARHLKRSIERLLVLPISNLVATGQVEVGDSVYVDLDDSGCDVAFSKRHGTPTISDLCVPEGELNPFYGAAVQSQQVGAMA